MKAFKAATFIVFFCFISGCQTTAEYLATFHGLHKNYLVGRMGKPDSKLEDGKGGEIWIYETKIVRTTPARIETTYEEEKNKKGKAFKKEKVIRPASESIVLKIKSFYINSEDIIYNTAYGSRYLKQ